MAIYYVGLIFTIILSIILTSKTVKVYPFYKHNVTYRRSLIAISPLFVIALLRWNVGVDVVYGTGYYFQEYKFIQNGGGNLLHYETGFYFLMKICNFLHFNLYHFYFLVTTIFILCIIYYIYKNSSNITFSIILFFVSDLYLFSFSTLRQALGIAFILFTISEIYYGKGTVKNWKIWLSIILAISMHTSVIYFLIVLLISKIKFNKKTLFRIVIIGCILGSIIEKIVYKLMTYTVYFSKYVGSNEFLLEFTPTYFILSLIIFIAAYLFYDRLIDLNNNNYILINISAITVVIMMNSSILIMPYRIFPLFIPVYIILCPQIVDCIRKNRSKRFLMMCYFLIPFIFSFINQYYIGRSFEIFKYDTILSHLKDLQ